jgi:hypothetical protein
MRITSLACESWICPTTGPHIFLGDFENVPRWLIQKLDDRLRKFPLVLHRLRYSLDWCALWCHGFIFLS